MHHTPELSDKVIRAAIANEGFDVLEEDDVVKDQYLKHLEYCKMCQFEHAQNEAKPSTSSERNTHRMAYGPASNPQLFKMTFSVGGMTCSSCTNSVTEALNGIDGISDVVVSLLDNSATVLADREELAEAAREAIEDCGMEAAIMSVEPALKTNIQNQSRSVSLRVDGMFCQ